MASQATSNSVTPMRAIWSKDPTEGRSATGAWEQMWQANVTPWDDSGVQSSLKELVEERWGEVEGVKWSSLEGGQALVAGCGRGYDAIYFASKGLSSLGIDLSETAIKAAKKHYSEISNAPTSVTFEAQDFFTFDKTQEGFSLAYDWTFLCALPPALREPLGKRYAELVKPGGVLITMIWPLKPVGSADGPPHQVTVDLYHQLFAPNFELVYLNSPSKEEPGKEGMRKVAVWVRKGGD